MNLFLADVHLKLGQKNVPKEWALNRYRMFFDQLSENYQDIGRLIVGGDLFDRLPSLEELKLYFEFVGRCKVDTYIYDGNHEATKKGQTFLSLLKDITSAINPLVTIVDEPTQYDWGTIIPYCHIHKLKEIKKGLVDFDKPLFTHVRGEVPPHVKPEIDLQLLADFPIVYAGDLHSHENSQLNIVYPGSPMTTSFHRSTVKTGYILFEECAWTWKEFNLPQLIRKTVDDPKDMVKTDYHHTIYELTGDLSELADVKATELLDKKLVKRSTEATLILDSNMTIEEELAEYLLYILELPENTVSDLIGTFRDSIKDTTMG